MQKTSIEYLTHSWNPVKMRCTPVSKGCWKCWHLRMAKRMAKNPKLPKEAQAAYIGCKPIVSDEIKDPIKVKKSCIIGVQFMGDLFHHSIPVFTVLEIFDVMAQCPQHIFIVLTKRPSLMKQFMERLNYYSKGEKTKDRGVVVLNREPHGEVKSMPNLWLGISVEDQRTADERIPILLQTPAAHRFVSYEPALGPVDFTKIKIGNQYPEYKREDWTINTLKQNYLTDGDCEFDKIDWLIVGGETGPSSRAMNTEWARLTREQCKKSDIPFFFKQMAGGYPIPEDLRIRQYPKEIQQCQTIRN